MTNAEARFNKIHIRKVYACLAVTCHLHFWQNDRDFLRATVVTRGWNGYRNKSQHRKSTLEKKILPPFQQGFEPATFWVNHESGALTTELSPPPELRGFIAWKRPVSDTKVLSVMVASTTFRLRQEVPGQSRLDCSGEEGRTLVLCPC